MSFDVPMPILEPHDLSDLSDKQWQQVIDRARSADERAQFILKHLLIENAHYGNPLGPDNQFAYEHPILYLAGAEKLQKALRLEYRVVAPDTETEVIPQSRDFSGRIIDPGYVSVTVYRSMSWWNGSVVGEHASNCNSREPRFEGADGGWRYDDAREVLNECIAIARKRVKVHLVCDVTGLRAWLHTEEEMQAALIKRAAAPRPAVSPQRSDR